MVSPLKSILSLDSDRGSKQCAKSNVLRSCGAKFDFSSSVVLFVGFVFLMETVNVQVVALS